MKVQFTAEMKHIVTVAEMPSVRSVIESERDDEWTAKEWAKMAARLVFDDNGAKVIEATARIAKNFRVRDAYGEDSADFDVWVKFTAFADDSFVMGGAYLTDLWAVSADNREETIKRMYIRRFEEVD